MHLTLKEQFTIVTDLRLGRLRLRPLKVVSVSELVMWLAFMDKS